MTLRSLVLLSSTALSSTALWAQAPAAEPDSGATATQSEASEAAATEPVADEAAIVDGLEEEAPIVITGGRLRGSVAGDIPAQNILDSRDVRATGATSINELLDALAPQIGSSQGRGGERPVLLLNGQRISGFRELRDIPTEAIERVEVLPEEVALKYGYGATQKVVNIVLRERFRSTTVEARVRQATGGGYTSAQGDGTRLMINRSGRTMVNVRAEGNGKLTEAERDLDDGGIDDQDARTLLGSKRLIRGSATANRTIFGDMSATLNAEAEHSEGRSLLGLDSTDLVVLGRDSKSDSLHAGFALNGEKSRWRWSLTGNGDYNRSKTGTDRDDPLFTRDRGLETVVSGDIAAVANGTLFKLPAGDAGVTVKLGAEAIDLAGERRRRGVVTKSSLDRAQANAALSLDLPISRRNRDFDALGNLSFNANAEVAELSDAGTLIRVGAGANWSPVDRLNFIASWNQEEGAPSVQQLGSPVLETPDSRLFDFTNGETVLATVITGGNPALGADRRKVWKLGANWRPFENTDLRLRGEYVRSTIDRPVQSLFGPTPTLEAAFPDRFVRDADGTLISADLRPINFDQARKDSLRVGFDFSKPLKSARPSQSVMDQLRTQFRGGRNRGAGRDAQQSTPATVPADAPPPPAGAEGAPPPRPEAGPEGTGGNARRGGFGGGRGGGGLFGGGNRGRLNFSLTDTITFVDKVSIGPGLPVIDYLRGDASGSSGGTPRHRVEAQAGWSNNGLGARLSANWRSGTKVDSLTAGTLRFAPLATLDLRLFANLGERPELVLKQPWLRGTSLRFEVSNILDEKPKVRDASGAVPLNYQSDLLDPLGRTVMISFRKVFLPNFGAIRRERERDGR